MVKLETERGLRSSLEGEKRHQACGALPAEDVNPEKDQNLVPSGVHGLTTGTGMATFCKGSGRLPLLLGEITKRTLSSSFFGKFCGPERRELRHAAGFRGMLPIIHGPLHKMSLWNLSHLRRNLWLKCQRSASFSSAKKRKINFF